MVQRAKSKRTGLKDKYKIQRKCAQANKNKGKAAKKKIGNNAGKKKLNKDPGIPSLWPFKDQLLRQIEAKQRSETAQKQREKEARQKQFAKDRARARSQPDHLCHKPSGLILRPFLSK